jgi:hypothetical protein
MRDLTHFHNDSLFSRAQWLMRSIKANLEELTQTLILFVVFTTEEHIDRRLSIDPRLPLYVDLVHAVLRRLGSEKGLSGRRSYGHSHYYPCNEVLVVAPEVLNRSLRTLTSYPLHTLDWTHG